MVRDVKLSEKSVEIIKELLEDRKCILESHYRLTPDIDQALKELKG